MAIDTNPGRSFIRYNGQSIHHVHKHQGVATEYWYLDTASGREFDIRELPRKYFGTDAQAVMAGDRAAHQRVICRAIDDGYAFW